MICLNLVNVIRQNCYFFKDVTGFIPLIPNI